MRYLNFGTKKSTNLLIALLPFLTIFLLFGVRALAQESGAEEVPFTKEMADAIAYNKIAVDTVWVLATAFLVFFMNLGFGMVESGLCRAKTPSTFCLKTSSSSPSLPWPSGSWAGVLCSATETVSWD